MLMRKRRRRKSLPWTRCKRRSGKIGFGVNPCFVLKGTPLWPGDAAFLNENAELLRLALTLLEQRNKDVSGLCLPSPARDANRSCAATV